MGDDKITFRIDDDTKRRLGGKHVNLSGIMRDLARRYAATGDTEEAALLVEREQHEDRIRELERDKGDIQAEINKRERQIEDINRRLQHRRENTTEEAKEVASMIRDGGFPMKNLEAENPAIENYAQKSGLEVENFIFEVREELDQ